MIKKRKILKISIDSPAAAGAEHRPNLFLSIIIYYTSILAEFTDTLQILKLQNL